MLVALALALASSRGAGCKSDLDCSLNGDCLPSGECECDAAWKGAQCHELDQLPTPVGGDIKEPNVTTWGGGPLQHKVGPSPPLLAPAAAAAASVAFLTSSNAVV